MLQGGTLVPYLFIICLDYVLRSSIDIMKESGFKLTKERSRRYHAKTITDANYADDITLLANSPTQTKTLLHSQERTTGDIGPHVNADKTEYMCFNQRGDVSTLNAETSGQVHLLRKQCLNNRESHQHAFSKGMDSYRSYG